MANKSDDSFEVVWNGAKSRPGSSTKGELLGEYSQKSTQTIHSYLRRKIHAKLEVAQKRGDEDGE